MNFTKIRKIINNILDLLFPKFCVGCGLEGVWLCKDCKENILPVLMQTCPDCGKVRSFGRYCTDCRAKYIIKIKNPDKKSKKKYLYEQTLFLNGIITSAYYEEGAIREVIHNFKYNGVTELADDLNNLLINTYKQINLKIDLVTFAPLHSKRLASRGYNQAEILAQKLSDKINIPLENLLRKTKSTKRQVELTGKKRRKNLKGVFKMTRQHHPDRSGGIYKKYSIRNKRILIIDDITTTGSTLNECAKVLKENGAKEVWGLVVARG